MLINTVHLDTLTYKEVFESYKRGKHKLNFGGVSSSEKRALIELSAYLLLRHNKMRDARTLGVRELYALGLC